MRKCASVSMQAASVSMPAVRLYNSTSAACGSTIELVSYIGIIDMINVKGAGLFL